MPYGDHNVDILVTSNNNGVLMSHILTAAFTRRYASGITYHLHH